MDVKLKASTKSGHIGASCRHSFFPKVFRIYAVNVLALRNLFFKGIAQLNSTYFKIINNL